ncbi:MAG: hypothetical protein O2822_01115 [Chloroflexi bacterium]|nr:hypothetical protein [Chloroflexota bacterium]
MSTDQFVRVVDRFLRLGFNVPTSEADPDVEDPAQPSESFAQSH